MALIKKDAALIVKDMDAEQQLMTQAAQTVMDKSLLESLGRNAYAMALKDSARIIAEEVIKLSKE